MFNGLGPHLSVSSPIGEKRPGFKFKNQLLELSISSFEYLSSIFVCVVPNLGSQTHSQLTTHPSRFGCKYNERIGIF
jgi:hypothetical protein